MNLIPFIVLEEDTIIPDRELYCVHQEDQNTVDQPGVINRQLFVLHIAQIKFPLVIPGKGALFGKDTHISLY